MVEKAGSLQAAGTALLAAAAAAATDSEADLGVDSEVDSVVDSAAAAAKAAAAKPAGGGRPERHAGRVAQLLAQNQKGARRGARRGGEPGVAGQLAGQLAAGDLGDEGEFRGRGRPANVTSGMNFYDSSRKTHRIASRARLPGARRLPAHPPPVLDPRRPKADFERVSALDA